MKKVLILAALAAVLMILPIAAYAQQHHHGGPRGEIQVYNDSRSQMTFFVYTERAGKLKWTFTPDHKGYLSHNNIRLRVKGYDKIQIADYPAANISEVGRFRNGRWFVSIRDALRILRNR